MLSEKGKKLKNIKYSNYKSVFSILRQADSRSIRDISQEIHLSNTAVAKIINALLEKNMVYPSGKGESTSEGGKRPELFSVNKDYRYAMVLQADTCIIKCCIFDLACQLRCEVICECGQESSYAEYLDKCAAAISKVLMKMQIPLAKILGCCIAFPGIIDSAAGVVVYPVWFPTWGKNLNFCEDLCSRLSFDMKMLIENNSRLNSYAQFSEFADHRQHGSYVGISSSDDYMCVTPGVGGCIFNNNHIRRGMNGYAGEFGHITVDYHDNENCVCGRKGCLQTITAPRRMVNYAYERREKHPDSTLWKIDTLRRLELRDIFAEANRGDPLAMEVVDVAITYYARAIENIILTVDPEYILFTGSFNCGGDYFLNKLKKRIHEAGLFGSVNALHIQYGKYSAEEAVLVGSALYLFDSFLNQDDYYADENT